jgi:hypothetical protein
LLLPPLLLPSLSVAFALFVTIDIALAAGAIALFVAVVFALATLAIAL